MKGPEFEGGMCAEGQCAANPRWRCAPIPLYPTSTKPRELSIKIIHSLTFALVANIEVKACNKLDFECTEPVTSATSGSDGVLKITVPENFAGFLQTEDSGFLPSLYYMLPYFPEDGALPNFPILPRGPWIDGLAVSLGSSIDPMRGNAILVIQDCFGMELEGISFTSAQADDKTITFYIRNGVPTPGAMDTPAEGDAGFLNHPPGTVVMTATHKMTGLDLGAVSFQIRKGWVTSVYQRPTTLFQK